MNIITIKYQVQEAKLENKIKREYHEIFNNVLTNCASIVSDTFNIRFHDKQVYSLAFPPTIYEMLWRYEYITFKSMITEQEALKKFSHQQSDRITEYMKSVKEND